jgi:hypothetical protein
MRPMKSTLPQATPRMRRCTGMRMRWSPSGPKHQFSPAGFELCWSTWALPPPPGTGSRKSRIQGGWSSKPSQRSSSDPESFADTRDQLSGPLTAMLLLMPPGRPSHCGSVATRVGCRTPSTTSCPTRRNQFKAYGVKRDIPRMEMVHHQDVTVELSTHLLAAQREIETLRIRLWNTNTTIRGYMRMVEGQASNLYVSDTDTWLATSSIQGRARNPQWAATPPSDLAVIRSHPS